MIIKPTHLDLFSGIGGFSLAAEWAGFKTIGFCEIDDFCSKVLKKHWPEIHNYGDIKEFNFNSPVDLITGGFPCQPFSVAGKKKGIEDERYLWPYFMQAIKNIKPAWVVAENVSGIVAMELDNILFDLENSGYEAQTYVIPACAAGAPHRRDRVWIIANRTIERCDFWIDTRKGRYLQDHINRNIETLQSQWEEFKPKSWKAFDVKSWARSLTDTNCISSEQTDSKPESIQDIRQTRVGHTRSDRENKTGIDRHENESPIPGIHDGLPNIVDRN